MDKPVVSVIVPVYNVEPYLRKCLDSLRSQSLSDIEVILVNDGSTDGSAELLRRAAEEDSRFHVIHQENRGTAAARYAGIQAARGEYVGFVDADDYVEPEMYARMYGEACIAQADLVVCGYWEHTGGGTVLRSVTPRRILIDGPNAPMEAYLRGAASFPSLCNKLYSRRLTGRLAAEPLPLKIGEDLAVCVALAPYVQRAVVLPEAFYHYIIHNSSAMHRRRRMDGEPNPLDLFVKDIAEGPAYDVPGNAWKNILAAQTFVSTVYSSYSHGQGARFFYSQIKKLRGWPQFDGFCRAVVSDRCLEPLRSAGGLSAKLSTGMRIAFLPCLAHMDRLAALLMALLRRMLEGFQTLREPRK